jgi:hypothetical protein
MLRPPAPASRIRHLLLPLALAAALVPAPGRAQSLTFLGSWPTQGSPLGLAIDRDGSVLLSTPTADPPLYRYTGNGALLVQLGFLGHIDIYGIAVAANGNIFYVYYESSRLWQMGPSGEDLGGWGRTECCFRNLTVDDATNIYITDPLNNLVLKYRASGATYADHFMGQWSAPKPSGIAVGGGSVYVASLEGGTILRFRPDGTPAGSFESGADGVEALAIGRDGRIYVVDRGRSAILTFSQAGVFENSVGSSPAGYADAPARYTGVAVADDGTVYAGDGDHGRILKFGPSATPVRMSGWGRVKALYR